MRTAPPKVVPRFPSPFNWKLSCVVGVGHRRTLDARSSVHPCANFRLKFPESALSPQRKSRCATVGHNPGPLSAVGGAGMDSTHHERPAGVPRFLQPSKDVVSAAGPESRHIFKEAKTGSGSSDDAEHFEPEARPFPVDAGSLAGGADILAGESPANNIGSCVFTSIYSFHVPQVRHAGPVLGEDPALIDRRFREGDRLKACGLERQGEPANPGEQVQHGGFHVFGYTE